jgi:hypothetical protein
MATNISLLIVFLFTQTFSVFCAFSDKDIKNVHRVKELFTEQNYQEALSLLLSLKHKNSAIFMLIAQCYEHLGKPTLLHAYLKKAYVYGNYQQKLKTKEKLVSLQGIAEQSLPEKLMQKTICFLDFLPMLVLQLLVFLLFFLLLYVISNQYLRMFFVFPSIIILFGAMIIKHNSNTPYGITLRETMLYSAPEEQAPTIGVVAENITVYYTEENNVFYKIETQDKKRGWIRKDTLMRIV